MGSASEESILRPKRLFRRDEVLERPSPVPAAAGVYGWYFDELPGEFDVRDCVTFEGRTLLYVGIAPAKPPANGRTASRKTLRTRITTHFRGNADASTLRMTLGCLLRQHLGIGLVRSASGRLTFGADGERILSDWMGNHASVVWVVASEPWHLEDALIESTDLPLNLKGNRDHANWRELTLARALARADSR